jgi:hypothetical protein
MLEMPTSPARVDGKSRKLKPAPLLGQHGVDVVPDWIGLGSGDIAASKRGGVL